jgi:hypothetical protein
MSWFIIYRGYGVQRARHSFDHGMFLDMRTSSE